MTASDKPDYPIPWIATFLLTALVLTAGSYFVGVYLDRVSYDYERNDPDFDYLERIARSVTPRSGDFSGLNGGDWTALCLIGAGGDVSRAPAQIRAALDGELGGLDETEFTFAYVAGDGAVKHFRHPHGFAFARAGASLCTARDMPVVELPAGVE